VEDNMPIQYVPPTTWVDSPEDMLRFARHVRDTGECAVDTETTGIDRSRDHVLFWSACPDVESRYCFSREMLAIWDAELSQDPDVKWYFTNQNFDFAMMMNSGVRAPRGDSYCTLAMDWLYDENRQGRHGLKETAQEYLGLNMREFKEAFKGKKKKESLQDRLLRAMDEDFESAISYASLDAWATFRVFHHLKKQLEGMHSLDGACLWDYFDEVEMPFTRVLHNCSRRGIMVDVGYLDELSPRIQTDVDYLQKQLNRIAGHEINPNSVQQLRKLLFDKLGLEPIKMTSGGASGNRQPSTDVETMARFADMGIEAAQIILDIRGLVKMKGTYVDGLRKWADDELRIHPTLTQHVAVTGRLSSVDPNLQNIPRPGGDKFGIRSAFMPKQDHVLIVADYEQLEMRLMAHYSRDPNMIEVINKGWDIHTGTASLMFEHKYEDIIAATKQKKIAAKDDSVTLTKLEKQMCFDRQAAKSIGFGLNYGEGPMKLGKTLGVSKDEAKRLMQQYFEPYPMVREFIDGVHKFILDHAMVETILGRPRRFHEMHAIGEMLETCSRWHLPGTAKSNLARAERQSVNSVIQGSAADVAKMAMIKCEFDPDLRRLGADMLLQVHDELLFEVPEEHADEAEEIIIYNMEHPFGDDLLVPLDVDSGRGYSWSSAKA
jgi:DNA polymerase-1